MPHLILEHNIEDEELMSRLCQKLHDRLSGQETVKKASIKTRSLKVSDVILGEGSKDFFTHLTLKLLPGRSEELRLQMSEALLAEMRDFLGDGCHSVEVMELQAYSKP